MTFHVWLNTTPIEGKICKAAGKRKQSTIQELIAALDAEEQPDSRQHISSVKDETIEDLALLILSHILQK